MNTTVPSNFLFTIQNSMHVSNAVASLNKLYSKQNLMEMVKTFHEIFNGIINTIVEEQ